MESHAEWWREAARLHREQSHEFRRSAACQEFSRFLKSDEWEAARSLLIASGSKIVFYVYPEVQGELRMNGYGFGVMLSSVYTGFQDAVHEGLVDAIDGWLAADKAREPEHFMPWLRNELDKIAKKVLLRQ